MKKTYLQLPLLFCLGFIAYLLTNHDDGILTIVYQGVIGSLTAALVILGLKEIIVSLVNKFSY